MTSGNNFYRLEMEDIDHQLSYSNVIVLSNGAFNGVTIYPNPVMNVVTISAANGQHATAILFSSNGQVMITKSFAGNNTITLDLGGYAAGLYMLRIVNGGTSSSYKLFKQ
jgi:Secretion system C-terminal sorting domain